jgi:hypothetical protein
MKRGPFAWALAGAALVAGVGAPTPAAPVPKHLLPKDEPLLYSVRVGDRHESTLFGGRAIVCVVTKAEKTAAGTLVEVVQEAVDGTQTHDETVLVSATGVRVIDYFGQKADESFWWVKLPHNENNTWSDLWGGQQKREWRTAGWEEVKVPAGTFRALRVDRDDGGGATSYWWAAGVGCVKWVSGNAGREMTAFKPGK